MRQGERQRQIERDRDLAWRKWAGYGGQAGYVGMLGTGTSRASEYTCRGAMDGSVLTERVSEPGHPTLPTPYPLLPLPATTTLPYPTPDCLSIRTRSLPSRTHSRAPCTDSALIVALTRCCIPHHIALSTYCIYLMDSIQQNSLSRCQLRQHKPVVIAYRWVQNDENNHIEPHQDIKFRFKIFVLEQSHLIENHYVH